MFKNRFLPLLFVCCTPFLSSCSTITEGSTQQITFKTVGAANASCDVQLGANSYRYNVHPPQTIWIQKTRSPIFVSCTAPGNRVANTSVVSLITDSTYFNILNAGLGIAVDGESGAVYKYPDEIIIDFMDSEAKDQPLPPYHNEGALDPSAQGIEYMGPDTPTLSEDKIMSDRYRAAYDEDTRLKAEKAAMDMERQRRIDDVEGGFNGDKGTPPRKSIVPQSLNEVQISPLSESTPSSVAPKESEAVIGQPTTPKLAKPLFPSSTSF